MGGVLVFEARRFWGVCFTREEKSGDGNVCQEHYCAFYRWAPFPNGSSKQ